MELRTSEERWRSLLNNPIFGVTFLDENQRFITTSRTFQNMVGYSDEELRQLTPLDISVPGERVVIDGPCLSACTLLIGIVPRHHVCVTKRAVLGFHAASYYDDVSRSLVPTRAGTRRLMRLYPPEVRSWIDRHGGLTPHLMTMHGRDLAALYPRC
jgi:hypothetical protein